MWLLFRGCASVALSSAHHAEHLGAELKVEDAVTATVPWQYLRLKKRTENTIPNPSPVPENRRENKNQLPVTGQPADFKKMLNAECWNASMLCVFLFSYFLVRYSVCPTLLQYCLSPCFTLSFLPVSANSVSYNGVVPLSNRRCCVAEHASNCTQTSALSAVPPWLKTCYKYVVI